MVVSLNVNGLFWGENIKIVKPTTWITGTESISTKRECNLKFKLDEILTSKEIQCKFHVDGTEMSKYS